MKAACVAVQRRVSTRLIRKGALVEETYRVFQTWDLSRSVPENLHHIRETNPLGASNEAWLREITVTLSSRFRTEAEVRPLVMLAQKPIPLSEWKAFLLWHVGRTDALYFEFAAGWLFKRFREGIHSMRAAAVLPFLRDMFHRLRGPGCNLSAYGLERGASDLLRMAAAFDLLQGRAVRSFTAYHLPERAFIYVLHALSELEPNGHKMMERPEWRLFLMTPGDVEREVLSLHQFRKLEYHAAGTLAQLKLPFKTALKYVESLTR